MDNGKIIKNYATALFANAILQSKEEKVFEQIQAIDQAINSDPKLIAIMCSPIITKFDKTTIIKSIVKTFMIEEVVQQFLLLLVKNSRMATLKYLVPYYQKLLHQSQNIKMVEVISSKVLGMKEQKVIKDYLESDLKQSVKIKFAHDQAIIGGIIIKYDSNLIDCSITGALNKIEKIAKQAKIAFAL